MFGSLFGMAHALSVLGMFGLGPMELAIIGGICVLLFGSRLPKLARSFGASIVEFKRGFTHGVEDVKQEVDSVKRLAESNFNEAARSVDREVNDVKRAVGG